MLAKHLYFPGKKFSQKMQNAIPSTNLDRRFVMFFFYKGYQMDNPQDKARLTQLNANTSLLVNF
ncbi:hypothetical protein MNBD_ALPHA11-345 [hydrothermal vent metagenome]|uniref:Uncharacterized protein n=1 Tax=hydrothermal vent metagenome TaxID=652676 RepID=A0A3B0U6J0_9ZZZZ